MPCRVDLSCRNSSTLHLLSSLRYSSLHNIILLITFLSRVQNCYTSAVLMVVLFPLFEYRFNLRLFPVNFNLRYKSYNENCIYLYCLRYLLQITISCKLQTKFVSLLFHVSSHSEATRKPLLVGFVHAGHKTCNC